MKENPVFVREAAFAMQQGLGRPIKNFRGTGRQGRGPARWSGLQILGELMRWDNADYLLHFDAHSGRTPEAPEIVSGIGVDPSQVRRTYDRIVSLAKGPDGRGRFVKTSRGEVRQRKDTPIVLSVVASFPVALDDRPTERQIALMSTSERRSFYVALVSERRATTLQSAAFVQWRDATIKWASNRYGKDKTLIAAVHLDESHLHLHMVFHNNGFSVKPMMAGPAAAVLARQSGATLAQARSADLRGKKALIDDYYTTVGKPCGLVRRTSTPQPRLPTPEYKRKKAQDVAEILLRQAEDDAQRMRRAAELEAETILENGRRRDAAALSRAKASIQEALSLEESRKRARIKEDEAGFHRQLDAIRGRENAWRSLLEEVEPDANQRGRLLAKHQLSAVPSWNVRP